MSVIAIISVEASTSVSLSFLVLSRLLYSSSSPLPTLLLLVESREKEVVENGRRQRQLIIRRQTRQTDRQTPLDKPTCDGLTVHVGEVVVDVLSSSTRAFRSASRLSTLDSRLLLLTPTNDDSDNSVRPPDSRQSTANNEQRNTPVVLKDCNLNSTLDQNVGSRLTMFLSDPIRRGFLSILYHISRKTVVG